MREPVGTFTLLVPYYRQPEMLRRQIAEWEKYPAEVLIDLGDDCSHEEAAPIVREVASPELRKRLRVFRTDVDRPWAREFVRNLLSKQAQTEWLLHVDIDHVLPAESASALLPIELDPKSWYRFPRYRVGKADETRRKDDIPDDAEFGKIKPHIDSYLVRGKRYWAAGGYNEEFIGVLGGGNEFLRRLELAAGPPHVLPESVCLHVYTRDKVKDSSDWACNRDTTPGKRLWLSLKAEKKLGEPKTLTLPWHREL